MTERGELFVGTSGFAFKEWKGVFYPEGVTDKKMLSYYSTVLDSVEINYTFRRMPAETTLEGWKEQCGESFRFTLKAPQRITHFKRLKDVGDDVDEFVRRARLLGDRLGIVLFQLPPNMKYDQVLLKSFLDGLPPIARYAMEFRNETWNTAEVDDLLTAASVARCGADTEAVPMKSLPSQAGHIYLRMRKEDYAPTEIEMWAGKANESLDSGKDVYCYFKHEDGAAGPAFAQAFKQAVNA